jgi:hypothetical protein
MVTVTTVIFSAALIAIVLPLTFTNPIRRTMYYVLLVCVAAIVSASSRALTAFRRAPHQTPKPAGFLSSLVSLF